MPTNVRDPRTIITPDAFEIHRELLGLPLAPPWRRFWAMMLDLTLVGVLTAVLSDVQLLLWTVIGLVLLRVALKKRGRSQAAALVMRVGVGCLGLGILGIVVAVFAFMSLEDPQEAVERAVVSGMRLSDAEMEGVEDADAAMAVFDDLLESLEDAPLSPDVKREILLGTVPPSASWAGQADSLADLALARAGLDTTGAGPGGATDPFAEDLGLGDADGAAAGSALLPVAELEADAVVAEFAALVEAGADPDEPRYRALRTRLAALVAADTLDALSDELADARDDLEDEQEARQDLQAELEEDRSAAAAFAALMRDVWDQLGSAIGLWSVYFTLLLTLWNGQTVGKRLMGVRVLRLDGAPLGWWPAFERAGGYVAGLATGLLGFAQVFWDPNRQCIHDKIVGTVVVDERAERVPGAWQQAWNAPTRTSEPTEP